MTDGILTPEEIEALLGELPVERRTLGATPSRLVFEYDLTRPSRVGRAQVDRIARVHEAMADAVAEQLTRVTDTSLRVDLVAIEQDRVDSFVDGLPDRCALFGIGDPERGVHGLVAVDPELLFGAIDAMLGGTGEAEMPARDLTATELSLAERLVEPAVRAIGDGWAEIVPLRLRIATRPGEARPEELDAESAVLAHSFLVESAGPRGMIRYCLATTGLAPHLSGLDPTRLLAAPDVPVNPAVRARLRPVPVRVAVELGRAMVPLREVTALAPGDVIPLDRLVDEPIEIRCGGRPKFRGFAGHRRGRFAVTIERRVLEEREEGEAPAYDAPAALPAPESATEVLEHA